VLLIAFKRQNCIGNTTRLVGSQEYRRLAAIFFASSPWRECTITLAPSRAKARAIANPILCVEPVSSSAILSFSNISVLQIIFFEL
jgi:hypothetical protein